MEIRTYRKEDIEELVDFTSDMFDITYKGLFSDEFLKDFRNKRDLRIEAELKDYDRRCNNVFLLIDNNKLIGYIEVDKCKHSDYSDHGEVEMIYINPTYQGKGLGRKLMSVGASRLKELGYNDFYVGCTHGNTSQKFYHHLGGEYKFSKPLILDQVYQEDYFYFKDVKEVI